MSSTIVPERRSSVLDSVSDKTKVVALIALVVEALFLLGAAFLPQQDRIWAFVVCGLLLLAALAGIFYIESLAHETHPKGSVTLPPEINHRAILISSYLNTAQGELGDRYRLATNLKYVGRYEDALRQYELIVRADPSHTLARYNVGSCLLYLDRDGEAENAYLDLTRDLAKQSWRGDEEKTRIYHGCYMQLYCLAERAKDFEKGEHLLIKSLDVRPDDVLSYLNLTICCLKSGKTAEGIKWYDILMRHPDRLVALTELEPTDQHLLDTVKQLKQHHENT